MNKEIHMKISIRKNLLFITSVLALSACSGGGGGSDSGTGVTGPSTPLTLVDGVAKSGSTEGVVFQEYVNIGSNCMDNGNLIADTYYESDNTLVFSEAGDVEEMRLIATIAEESIKYVSEQFNLIPADILEYRPIYSHVVMNTLSPLLESQVRSGATGPDNVFVEMVGEESLPVSGDVFVDDWEYEQRERFYFQHWTSLSAIEQDLFLGELSLYTDADLSFTEKRVPRKVQICLALNPEAIGVANSEGFSVKYPSQLPSYLQDNNYQGFRRIMQHEMVHMVSMIVTNHFDAGTAVDTWFEEGVAEYLTNGSRASNPTLFNPVVRSKNNSSAFLTDGIDQGKQYAVFTSAVEYLFSSSGNRLGAGNGSIFNIWLNIRNSDLRTGDYFDTQEIIQVEENDFGVAWIKHAFVEAFDDEFGSLGLTYDEYESDYILIHQSL